MRPDADFGELLRRLRQQADLTQEAFAEQVGCATQTLRAFERGRRRPSREMAERLADVLQIPPADRAAFVRLARSARELDLPDAGPPSVAPQSGTLSADLSPARRLLTPDTWPLIGRSAELRAAQERLASPGVRLLTITGPGGIGKSRLAQQIAVDLMPRFADGAAVMLLAGAESGAAALTMIAAALQVPLQSHVPIAAAIVATLTPQRRLLVLDNLEHLLGVPEIPSLIAAIVREAPGVQILATSRERLRLSGEWVVELGGLSIPSEPGGSDLDQSDAALLFIERARQQGALALAPENRRAIAQICRLLEGNPLAIELAAAWVSVLSCAEIAAEIARSLDFLSLADRDRPAEHRSMRVVFEHSWRLLTPVEQQILARLSVFRGGFLREVALFVAGAQLPQLAALVQKSLLHRSGDHYLLHTLVRRYAAERLTALADAEVTRRRFSDFYLAQSAQGSQQFAESGRRALYDALLLEIDNLRAALQHALDAGRAEQAARLCVSLRAFWGLHGLFQEGVRWAERALALGGLPDALRGDLFATISSLVWHLGDLDRAQATAAQALDAQRRAGDPEGLALALSCLGRAMLDRGDYARAQDLYAECVALRRGVIGAHSLAWGLIMLGLTLVLAGDAERARGHFDEALELSRRVGDRFTEGGVLNYRGLGLALAGDRDGAALSAEALRILSEPAYLPGLAIALESLAAQAGLRARHRLAAQLAGVAQALRGRIESPATAICRADYERLFVVARGPLSDSLWASGLAEGRALPLQRAIALAESLVDAPGAQRPSPAVGGW